MQCAVEVSPCAREASGRHPKTTRGCPLSILTLQLATVPGQIFVSEAMGTKISTLEIPIQGSQTQEKATQ